LLLITGNGQLHGAQTLSNNCQSGIEERSGQALLWKEASTMNDDDQINDYNDVNQ
jgi:hypothetical protein